MTDARAVGKQMFLEFDNGLWLRVHLGMYGAWDFAGEILMDATIASANGRMGQTNQRGTDLDSRSIDARRRELDALDRRPAAHPGAHGGAEKESDALGDVPARADRAGAGAAAHRHGLRRPPRPDRL